MTIFRQPVDKRSRKAMESYLVNHYRYNTMNTWNNSTSYAHNLKVHSLGLDIDIVNKLYNMIQTDEFYYNISDMIHEFGEEYDFRWQAGWSGRSGGYLVMYQGERKPSGYKSFCSKCGQLNFTSVSETGNVCGRCRQPARKDFTNVHMSINTFPGRSIDQNENFEDWDMYSLRDRTELVQSFDALADVIVAEAVYMAENYNVCEKTVYVPQKRMVMATILQSQ